MGNRKTDSLLAVAVMLTALPAVAQMSLPGKFEVTDTGSASYTIPISLVPGTAGLEPKLSLHYDSRSGNGLLGVGWSLSGLPAITRCGKTIAQDGAVGGVSFDANDRFCLDGQRLIAINGGSYGADQTEYRTERESFSKVVSYGSAGSGPAWFKVWTKAGLIMEFGNSADSRIEAQGKASVRVWAINKTSDTKGNYFSVSYAEDTANGSYQPSRINYTGNGSTAPSNSVRFVYEARPDIVPLYQAGSLIKTTQRMTKVQAWQEQTLVREYTAAFTQETATGVTKLQKLSLCHDGAAACLPEIVLQWKGGGSPSWASYPVIDNNLSPGQGFTTAAVYPFLLGDWNGDGLTDIARVSGNDVGFYKSTGNGFVYWTSYSNLSPAHGFTDAGTYPFITGNWNRDGFTDIARVHGSGLSFYAATANGITSTFNYASLSPQQGYSNDGVYPLLAGDWDGDGVTDVARVHGSGLTFFRTVAGGLTWLANIENLSPAQGFSDANTYPVLTGDWNGDGLTDIARVSGSGISFWHSTGAGFYPAFSISSLSPAQGFSDANTYPVLTGDWNGDGLTDIARVHGSGVGFWLSTGTGFYPAFSISNLSPAQGFSDGNTYPVLTGDWNGDGLTDIARVHGSGIGFWLSTGTGFYPASSISNFSPAQGFSDGNAYPISTGDWNGDGLTDFMRVHGNGIAGQVSVFIQPAIEQIVTPLTTTSIGYRSIAADPSLYTKDADGADCLPPCLNIQNATYVVAEVKSSNGLGGAYRSTYRYAGAKVDSHGRGFLGFRQMTVKDEQTGVEQVTAYRQDYPFTGLVASREKTLGAQLLNRSTNSYSATDLGGTRRYPFLTSSLEESWELSGAALPAVTTSYQYDAFGNATQVGVSTGDGHTKVTTNSYNNDTANWLLGRLTRSDVTSTVPGN